MLYGFLVGREVYQTKCRLQFGTNNVLLWGWQYIYTQSRYMDIEIVENHFGFNDLKPSLFYVLVLCQETFSFGFNMLEILLVQPNV